MRNGNVKTTMFGRHYTHMMVKHASEHTNIGVLFEVSAPKNGYIIEPTVKAFGKDALQYVYVQRLNNCDACIVTTSCVHSVGHFNSTIRLVSYDTVIAEVRFLSENRNDDTKPYMEMIIGEHWNYSRTTIQHLYKFLRMFGVTDICINDYAKSDKSLGSGTYSYATYACTNNVGNKFVLRFSSARAITDFALNNAQHVIDRYMR